MTTDTQQPVAQHLSELRRMLVRTLIAIGIAALGSFAFAPFLFKTLQQPYLRLLARHGEANTAIFLQTLDPAETLKLSFTLAIVLGTVLVLPYLLYEAWRFVRPGLKQSEKKWTLPILFFGTLLFFSGAAFAYFAVTPLALGFFWEYSLRLGVTPAWTIGKYIHFLLSTLVAFGIAFELPVVTTILAACGFITAHTLTRVRRYAVFAICVLSALITPADVVSLLLMAIPLIGLYEISIILARIVGKKQDVETRDVANLD